jgi:purine catabolism regulator
MITVGEVLRAVLPAETDVIAAPDSLAREVTWATRPRPSPPAFAHLSGGELVLLSSSSLSNLDERLTLEGAVRQLAKFGVAAIAHAGPVTAKARAAAQETSVAFLQLPVGADLGSLEREASHFILERRRDQQRRGQDAGRRLMELAISGEGIAVIARNLAELAERSVALEGRDGKVLAFAQPPASQAGRIEIEPLLIESRSDILGWLRMTSAGSPAEPPSTAYPLGSDWRRVVAPIIGRDGLLGNISVIVGAGDESPEDDVLASRGAAACSVVMAREYAAQAARREIEINVLDEVFDGALRSEVSLLQQAKRLNYDLHNPHAVLVASVDSTRVGGIQRSADSRFAFFDEVMARRGPRILWRIRHNAIELLWPVANTAEAKTLASSLHDEMAKRLADPGLNVSIGGGRVQEGLIGIQRAHQEAKQALIMGRRLHGPGGVTWFDELGVYRLIFAAEHLPELGAFHDEALSALIDYDREHNADLVRTLKAFFDATCGPKEAAALLGVHLHTVLYRLDRIREITGVDLDNADVRLRLHLALCIHLALTRDDR